LYKIHLECAKYWNVMWQYIQTASNTQLDKMMDYIRNSYMLWSLLGSSSGRTYTKRSFM